MPHLNFSFQNNVIVVKNAFMFKFDLKSDYFHLDIFPQQHTYLGFMWKGKFYCFTVLVFGISTTHIFLLNV
jgi:hypothetical protein